MMPISSMKPLIIPFQIILAPSKLTRPLLKVIAHAEFKHVEVSHSHYTRRLWLPTLNMVRLSIWCVFSNLFEESRYAIHLSAVITKWVVYMQCLLHLHTGWGKPVTMQCPSLNWFHQQTMRLLFNNPHPCKVLLYAYLFACSKSFT